MHLHLTLNSKGMSQDPFKSITRHSLHYLGVGLILELGPIRTSRQNRNCPWQNPRTNFVVTIFVSSVASALTWLKSSNCVVGWQLACLKNCSSQSVSLQHVDSQTGHREAAQNRLFNYI